MQKEKEVKWQCPVCGDKRYQKYGGVTVPAISIDSFNSTGTPNTSVHMGQHFMCKGCSVFFSNPRLFNLEAIEQKKGNNNVA